MTFEQLLDDQAPALKRRLARMLGDPWAAEDLCQDVLLRAWRAAPRDVPDAVVRAWLHRTAVNAGVDELRRRARGARALTAEGAWDGDLAEGLAVRDALGRLPVAERLVLELRFVRGLAHAEVARVLGVSEEAARKRAARARAALRRELADSDPRPLVALLVRDCDPAPYVAWLERAGARVRCVRSGEAAREALLAQALVITSSVSDLHPAAYGEPVREVLHGTPDARADRRDALAIRQALELDLPVLGVCAGHQLLNVACGGTLFQDLAGDGAGDEAHARELHRVGTTAGTRLRQVCGSRAEVRSRHHQAVRRLGRGLRATAWSPDGVVEAVEHPGRRFAVGVQWHPQDNATELGAALGEALVEAAA